MAKQLTEIQKKHKELVQEMLVSKGPIMMTKAMQFIENHFDDEDKEYRRDAHKLFAKWFDSQIPKTQVLQVEDNRQPLDPRFEQFLNSISMQSRKEIQVEEAEIIPEEEALSVRRIGK